MSNQTIANLALRTPSGISSLPHPKLTPRVQHQFEVRRRSTNPSSLFFVGSFLSKAIVILASGCFASWAKAVFMTFESLKISGLACCRFPVGRPLIVLYRYPPHSYPQRVAASAHPRKRLSMDRRPKCTPQAGNVYAHCALRNVDQ